MIQFEYDAHIALTYQDSPLSLQFPHSAVLYLLDNGNIPDDLPCTIHFQDGGTYTYKVPAIKVQTYSLEEIQKKHLSILIPFLPLRFRKFIQPAKNKSNFSKEELTSFYEQIILILEQEVRDNYLSENNRNAILNLLNKSLIRVFYQDKSLLQEVVAMTEPILELEIEKYIYALEDKINENNLIREELAQANHEIIQKNNELNRNYEAIALKDNELTQKDIEIAALKKQIEQLQKRF